MLILLIVRADLRCDVGQMNVVHSINFICMVHLPVKKLFLIDFSRSPVFEKQRCKQTVSFNYSCNYGMGIQHPVNTGKPTGVSQLAVTVSGWDSCSSLSQCTVTTAMGNRFVLLNFKPLLVNIGLKYHREWQYLSMAELQ